MDICHNYLINNYNNDLNYMFKKFIEIVNKT